MGPFCFFCSLTTKGAKIFERVVRAVLGKVIPSSGETLPAAREISPIWSKYKSLLQSGHPHLCGS